jgi:2,3,4,5-tetrahydropyridine-2-carboxylate N-succinyltransferase
MEPLQRIIESAWEERTTLTPAAAHTEAGAAVNEAIALLDSGRLRVA